MMMMIMVMTVMITIQLWQYESWRPQYQYLQSHIYKHGYSSFQTFCSLCTATRFTLHYHIELASHDHRIIDSHYCYFTENLQVLNNEY